MSRVQPARRVAFDVLRAVSDADAYANLLLPAAIGAAGLFAADAAFATELTYGTLRRRNTYDAVIALAARRAAESIDPEVLDALRLGVHQLLSTRVASHAAVDQSVALVREVAGPAPSGFVNAVLRRIARDTPGHWLDAIERSARSDDERLALRYSHPVWVIRAFRRALAAEDRADELTALLEADNRAPGVTMAALPGLIDPPAEAARTLYSPLGFRLGGGAPEPLVASSDGRFRVQDEGSQLAALALTRARPIAPGERWLDLCAGPGGKTAVLAAEALQGGAVLDANEPVPARARLVRDSIAGVPLAVEVSELDGRERAASAPESYDRILVDAPCTGLGALRRRPEARWRKTASDVQPLASLQRELVHAALDAARPGGIVAYVTCSPHRAETVDVVADVLAHRADATALDSRAVVRSLGRIAPDLPTPADGSQAAQLWPHRHGTDAMFIALLQRTA